MKKKDLTKRCRGNVSSPSAISHISFDINHLNTRLAEPVIFQRWGRGRNETGTHVVVVLILFACPNGIAITAMNCNQQVI